MAVGSHPSGNGNHGATPTSPEACSSGCSTATTQLEYAGGGASCSNCADLADTSTRVVRGGSWLTGTDYLRAAARVDDVPTDRSFNSGVRCARAR